MQFLVLSREKIKKFETDSPHAIISISTPEEQPAKFRTGNCKGVLRLQFHDWGEDAKKRIQGKENSPLAQRQVFFNEQDAKDIVNFVNRNLKKVEFIICQCDAGISRSAGVAAALSKYITGSDDYYFKHYIPNSLVYKLMLNELFSQEE